MKKSSQVILFFAFLSSVVVYILASVDIVKPKDYEAYMNPTHLEASQEILVNEMLFWKNKLEKDPENFVYQKKMASLYAAEFKLTGKALSLQKSDDLFNQINDRIPNQVGVLQAMSSNAITRHDFREAEGLAIEAIQIGERKFASTLLQVDALLERGQLGQAKQVMKDISSTSHFDFLIRNVKLNDQSGDLASAIADMEKASEIAKSSRKKSLINWSLSNLADMYGHDGRVQKSYDTYLQALTYNPADLHSLKGIAWIAFSKDKNTTEAKRIISFLQSVHPVPDYDLLLAEIATFEENEHKAGEYEARFLDNASQPEYGNMYQSYIGYINKNADQVMAIALAEIENRPHPMSYNLLAWANFQLGEKAKAVQILRDHVIGQTEEPNALFYSGLILEGSGQTEQAKELLNEALDASFELGPVATLKIKESLNSL